MELINALIGFFRFLTFLKNCPSYGQFCTGPKMTFLMTSSSGIKQTFKEFTYFYRYDPQSLYEYGSLYYVFDSNSSTASFQMTIHCLFQFLLLLLLLYLISRFKQQKMKPLSFRIICKSFIIQIDFSLLSILFIVLRLKVLSVFFLIVLLFLQAIHREASRLLLLFEGHP